MSVVNETSNPNFKVESFVDAEQLKQDVSFSLSDLDNAVREQAPLYVHYAVLAGQARRQYERLKGTFEILESKLSAKYRNELAEGGRKVTEAAIEAAIKSDPLWYAAHERVLDARQIMDLANDAREAFSMRKDMLIQVTADRRKEAEGEMRVKAAQEISDTTRDRITEIIRRQQRGEFDKVSQS